MPGPHRVPFVGNTHFLARCGETGVSGNIYVGLHEFWEMAFVAHVLRPGDLFVDVGANAGSYTLLAAGWCGATVVAVEPSADAFARLETNVRSNGLDTRVELHRCAVVDRNASVLFRTDSDTTNHIVRDPEAEQGEIVEVPLRTLDDVLGERSPALMKIDVEGEELSVLRGASRVLRDGNLRAVLVETPEHAGSPRDNPSISLLLDAGFQRYHYDPWTRELTLTPVHTGSNVLFVRDQSWVANRLHDGPKLQVLGEAL